MTPDRNPVAAKRGWTLLGPAFVAAIAYVDPGNIAANVSAGAEFGFLLVWVIVVANVMAALVQYLSAKLGLVTGRTLPEAVRETSVVAKAPTPSRARTPQSEKPSAPGLRCSSRSVCWPPAWPRHRWAPTRAR